MMSEQNTYKFQIFFIYLLDKPLCIVSWIDNVTASAFLLKNNIAVAF